MPNKQIETKTEQQRKRQRINRIKNGIIITITSWMLLSLIAIVVLIVQVVSLNGKIKKLNEEYTSVVAEIQNIPAQTETLAVEETETEENLYADVVTGLDTEDNMYQEGDERKVYLTFDCVPSENTNEILDVLKQYGIKATFFVTGDESEEALAIYQRIVDEGHTLAMHSYSNSYSTIYASSDAFRADTLKLQEYLESATGVTSLYYRFPGGSFNEISDLNMAEFVHILNEDGITYFDWNVTAGDAAGEYTAEDVIYNVTTGVSNYKTSVVLLHDSMDKTTTTETLGSLIEELTGMEASILPIDESTYKVQYIKADSVN